MFFKAEIELVCLEFNGDNRHTCTFGLQAVNKTILHDKNESKTYHNEIYNTLIINAVLF